MVWLDILIILIMDIFIIIKQFYLINYIYYSENNMCFLSIVTPTFNRENTLTRVYNSLLNQSNKQFEWLIIDDGSIDNTKKLCKTFINKNLIKVSYYQKTNGGKHTALNFSHKYISGDLVLILDSDDYLKEDAVELILSDWHNYSMNSEICGLSYLKCIKNGRIVGKEYYANYMIDDFINVRINDNNFGDKCEVIRTDIFKKYPFPVFKDEKFLGEGYLWGLIAYKYKTVYINKVIYVCDYLEGGLTKSGRKLRINNPYGGMAHALIYINKKVKLKYRLKNIILYYCYARFLDLKFKDCKKNIKINFFENVLGLLLSWFVFIKWKRIK